MLAIHKQLPLDAVVIAGDNFYPCGIRQPGDPAWARAAPLGTLGVPLLVALGNHDHCGDPMMQVGATDVPHWTMPAPEFVVTSSVADFVFLDSTPIALGQNSAGPAILRGGFASSRRRWRIVVSHHPPVSSGMHGRTRHDGLKQIRALAPVMRDLGIDLIISGHDHHEELIDWNPSVLISGAGSDPEPLSQLRPDTRWPRAVRSEPIAFSVLEIRPHSMRVRFYDSGGKPLSDWLEVPRRDK